MKLKGYTTYIVPLWYYIILAPLCLFFKLWLATIRIKYSEETKNAISADKRVIALIWHNRIFVTPLLRRHFRKQYRMSGLVSPSRDGAWLAGVFRLFDIETIRGSSKRRGGVALKEMADAIEDGSDVCITPDGPRGPKYSIKKGALKLAEISGVDLLMVRANYSRFFKINTWDDFMFPLPFSTVELIAEPLINYEEVCRRATLQAITPENFVENALGR
jgi:Uncharacterized protein conserved in bacteria